MPKSLDVDIAGITDPGKAVIVKLNFRSEIFEQVFSKLEMINALEYLAESAGRLKIPEIYVDTSYKKNQRNAGFVEYQKIKDDRRKSRTAPKSILDSGLNLDFNKFLPNVENQLICDSGDLFSCKEFQDSLSKFGRETIMLTGFFTELDVLRTASSSLENGYFGVTISDATSTYSERIYYEALDLISQSSEVIDTRDLMKLWP